MNQTTAEILEEIKQVQAERRKNWRSVAGPTDAELEGQHLARLKELRFSLVYEIL